MSKQTPLHELHVEAGAKFFDFAGWSMPLHYGSQVAEHHQVRRHAGMFDVSHMGIVDVTGTDATAYLRSLLAGDVGRLQTSGQAMYSVMLNDAGGVLDDLIVYRLEQGFRLVLNAATTDSDLSWMRQIGARAECDIDISPPRSDAMLAVQGPQAIPLLERLLGCEIEQTIKSFQALEYDGLQIARTGYTGEDGVELIGAAAALRSLWRELRIVGVQPAGLGARDSLRLEAGLNLYGVDMDDSVSPLESNLAWTVHWDPPERTFVGRDSLVRQRAAKTARKLTGVVLTDPGVIRAGCRVFTTAGDGSVTSGSFSPTLGYSLGLARVPRAAQGAIEVEVRNRRLAGVLVRPPFVRHGKKVHA